MRSARIYLLFLFFLLVSHRLGGGSCAFINPQETPVLSNRGETTEDGSLSNRGVSCSDDRKVVALRQTGCSSIQRRLLRPQGLESSIHTSGNSTEPEPAGRRLPHWAIYTIAISGVVVFVAVAAATTYLLLSRRKKDTTVMPWSTGLSGPIRKAFVAGVPSLGRAELQTACEDFINVIDSSSECTLYKGTLSSGVEIAVVSTSADSAKDWSDRSEQQFKNKISVLSRVNHKNLMNLLGYCTSEEPFARMMVFEYAPCGSLFEHLHIREAEDLDWPTRLRIVMGVAYCLEHMSQLDPPVMPATLSSSSIYLTEDYAAKIADMDFCKGDDDRDLRDEESVVYRFGILLLEVISGRLPFSEDHGLLVLWASSYLDGKRPLIGMADPMLRSSVPGQDLAALCDVVRLCLCIHPEREREKRPAAMGEVARLMRGVTDLSPEQATPRDNPLWWAQLEIASTAQSGPDEQIHHN